MDMNKILAAIHSMNPDELQSVAEAVKLRRQYHTRATVRSMVVGDRVWFDSGKRGIVRGVVTKINRKTVGIRADSGMNWRVAGSLINRETVE